MWMGDLPQPYWTKYEKKTNESDDSWSDLIHFIDVLNNAPAEAYTDSLDAAMNTSTYLKSWATTQIFSNFDSYTGSGHNYFIYHNTTTNQFEWINWDVNESFGNFNFGNTIGNMLTVPTDFVPLPPNARPLNMKMKDELLYWSEFEEFICSAVNGYFNESYLFPVIDSLYLAIKEHVYADPNKFYSNQQFDQNIEQTVLSLHGIKPFIQQRGQNLLTQIGTTTCNTLSIAEEDQPVFSVFPNPSQSNFYLKLPTHKVGIKTISLSDACGRSVQFETMNQADRIAISILDKIPGVYVLRVVLGDETSATTMLIQE